MTRFAPTLIEVRKLVGKRASSIHIHLNKEVVHKASFDRRFHSDLGCKLIGDTENSITTNIKPPKTTKNIKPVRLRGCPSDLVSAVNTSSATETSFIDTQCHCNTSPGHVNPQQLPSSRSTITATNLLIQLSCESYWGMEETHGNPTHYLHVPNLRLEIERPYS